jgi:hypothetical protein
MTETHGVKTRHQLARVFVGSSHPKRLTVESEVACVATSAFDDLSRPRYDKLWRISVLRVVVSFLFPIAIRWINARGIWYPVADR